MEKNEYRDMFSKLHTSINEEDIIMHQNRNRKPRVAALLLAAALVMALAVGAAAIYRNSLRDLVLRSEETPTPEIQNTERDAEPVETPQSQSYDPLPGDRDMISLQGYAGSPEYQAALAWAEFQHGYDRDGTELKRVGNKPTDFEEKYSYNGYHVYTQAMADKIDEISAQYGLALHTGGMQAATVAELEARFGDFLSTYNYGGYYYADGTFQSDCEQGGISFQLRRCMKGTLDTVLLNITDAEQYEQWEYETASGVTVLLALGPDKALILADLDESFVAVNVLGGTAAPEPGTEDEFAPSPMTAERLQALADSIDFSIL
jgi:hypothetical protein